MNGKQVSIKRRGMKMKRGIASVSHKEDNRETMSRESANVIVEARYSFSF